MVIEAIGFGNNINEAKEDAMSKLGASVDDEIQFEVIATQKKKVLGIFGGCQAQVRAYVEKPDPKPKKERKPASKKQHEKAEQNAKKPKENGKKAEKAQTAPKQDAATNQMAGQENTVDAALIPADSPSGRAVAYLKAILAHLGCENTQMKVAAGDNSAVIVLEGEGLGVIIGHRGETLDSLQYLTSLAANSGSGYFKVTLNIGNYREKREQTLIALASRVSAQVLRTGRSRSLEPMNPYERRIIHTAIQDIDGVLSNSIGEGNRRRVVIYPEGGEMRPARRERDDRSHRSGRGSGNRRASSVATAAPAREPKKDTDIPLYGKIN